ncbi:hypothetical protein ACIJYG_00805 [Candidatus Pelagibacter bacterium nBUS_27]|uniref:hypothetical protein n=1 Tax=Candidatus Pelagibacter bacterium nBUS_27 TaxID=3374188 RepID=UPI003EBFABE7
MSKNKVPIADILDLIKKKIILVSIIFTISIGLSFFYNLSFKTIKYNYTIEFIPMSNWRASELGLNDVFVNGLTRSLILEQLKNINQISYKLGTSDVISVSFQSYQPVDIQGFEQKLNFNLDSAIKNKLESRVSFLEFENKNILEMVSQYGKLLSKDINLDELSTNSNYDLKHIIDLKKEYYLLRKKILTTQKELDLIDKDPNNFVQLGNLFSESDVLQRNISILNNLNKNESEIFSLKERLKDFNLVESSNINSIRGWGISDNNLSYLEMIIAGILFGLLGNSFILFLSSSYFKKNILN